MSSLLIKSGILSDQNNSKEEKERPKFARLSAQALPPVDMGHYTSHVS